MQGERQFRKEIYKYCDDNVGEKILFTGFTNLYIQLEHEITPKNLASLTSEIIHELIGRKILIEVPKEFESVYGMYEILPHEKLIKDDKKY